MNPRRTSRVSTRRIEARPPAEAAAAAETTWRELIRRCRVLALATAAPGRSWSAPLFFAAWSGGGDPRAPIRHLVFLTSPASRHGRDLARTPRCSAAFWLAPPAIGGLRGVQLAGRAQPIEAALLPRAKAAFLARHPAAAKRVEGATRERLYSLAIDTLKVTDNRRGFGWKCTLGRGGQPPKTANRFGT
ncbi:MAG: hypothetical protein FJ293_10600 [Planctomycetes bacterium]|nr:hypothetical protein [Planctomycetota bacterium]